MNVKIALIITFSLLLAGCLSTQSESSTTPSPTTESATVQQVETASLQIADAFASGNPLRCETTPSTAGEPASTYYIKNSKMRMESVPSAENESQYFSINDGTTIFMWSADPAVPGMKMSLEAIKKSADSFDNQLQNFPDLTDQNEREKIEKSGSTITCTEATIDDSMFVPPSDIIFRDFSEVMGGAMENIPQQ